jgi:hypothetical protein
MLVDQKSFIADLDKEISLLIWDHLEARRQAVKPGKTFSPDNLGRAIYAKVKTEILTDVRMRLDVDWNGDGSECIAGLISEIDARTAAIDADIASGRYRDLIELHEARFEALGFKEARSLIVDAFEIEEDDMDEQPTL